MSADIYVRMLPRAISPIVKVLQTFTPGNSMFTLLHRCAENNTFGRVLAQNQKE